MATVSRVSIALCATIYVIDIYRSYSVRSTDNRKGFIKELVSAGIVSEVPEDLGQIHQMNPNAGIVVTVKLLRSIDSGAGKCLRLRQLVTPR